MINIFHKDTGKVLFTVNADSLRRANLSGADLRHADLPVADLSGADLRHANLYGANLYGASLSGASLSDANLCGADLSGANLYGANLYGANLSGSNLSGSNLYDAYLRRADLSGANLCGADLRHANLSGAVSIPEIVAARLSIVPEVGSSYIGWKKCENETIVKLLIPEDAKRSNATGRKCRAECAKVLEVFSKDGRNYGVSLHDYNVKYYVGQIVYCDAWDENRWNECSGGIHHFITRAEAEAY